MHDHTHHVDFDAPELAARAELEGEVLSDLVTEATAELAEVCRRHGTEVARVLDLGCGPGVGTCLLAERFGAARVVAVDGSATMLARARARADRHGFGDRVEILRGLSPDDRIVVSGAFLLNSESQLKSAMGGMSTESGSTPSESNSKKGGSHDRSNH